MEIAFLLFDDVTALDAIGPYEVLSRIPGARVRFVATEPGPQRTARGMLHLIADHPLDEIPHPDVVVVPGGPGTRALLHNEQVLTWIRSTHEHSRWTTSVCTGALLLGAAGILTDRHATTHWRALDALPTYGATPIRQRVVEDGKIITAAGVSAGIDMALHLAQREAGDDIARALQLVIEYDPQPRTDAGSPLHAPEHVLALAHHLLDTQVSP